MPRDFGKSANFRVPSADPSFEQKHNISRESQFPIFTPDAVDGERLTGTDATDAIQDVLTSLGNAGGGVCAVPKGNWKLDHQLRQPSGVIIHLEKGARLYGNWYGLRLKVTSSAGFSKGENVVINGNTYRILFIPNANDIFISVTPEQVVPTTGTITGKEARTTITSVDQVTNKHTALIVNEDLVVWDGFFTDPGPFDWESETLTTDIGLTGNGWIGWSKAVRKLGQTNRAGGVGTTGPTLSYSGVDGFVGSSGVTLQTPYREWTAFIVGKNGRQLWNVERTTSTQVLEDGIHIYAGKNIVAHGHNIECGDDMIAFGGGGAECSDITITGITGKTLRGNIFRFSHARAGATSGYGEIQSKMQRIYCQGTGTAGEESNSGIYYECSLYWTLTVSGVSGSISSGDTLTDSAGNVYNVTSYNGSNTVVVNAFSTRDPVSGAFTTDESASGTVSSVSASNTSYKNLRNCKAEIQVQHGDDSLLGIGSDLVTFSGGWKCEAIARADRVNSRAFRAFSGEDNRLEIYAGQPRQNIEYQGQVYDSVGDLTLSGQVFCASTLGGINTENAKLIVGDLEVNEIPTSTAGLIVGAGSNVEIQGKYIPKKKSSATSTIGVEVKAASSSLRIDSNADLTNVDIPTLGVTTSTPGEYRVQDNVPGLNSDIELVLEAGDFISEGGVSQFVRIGTSILSGWQVGESTTEYISASVVVPEGAKSITDIRLRYLVTASVGSENIRWACEAKGYALGDTVTTGADYTASTNAQNPTGANILQEYVFDVDSIDVEGKDRVQIRPSRVGNSVTDSFTGDAFVTEAVVTFRR